MQYTSRCEGLCRCVDFSYGLRGKKMFLGQHFQRYVASAIKYAKISKYVPLCLAAINEFSIFFKASIWVSSLFSEDDNEVEQDVKPHQKI